MIHLASSLTVDIPKDSYDFARGDSAVIPCKFLTEITGKPVIILWTAQPDNPADPAVMNSLQNNFLLMLLQHFPFHLPLIS